MTEVTYIVRVSIFKGSDYQFKLNIKNAVCTCMSVFIDTIIVIDKPLKNHNILDLVMYMYRIWLLFTCDTVT